MSSCCKCSEEEKIKILFQLYDSDSDEFMEKREILCMVALNCSSRCLTLNKLYNYPKNHISNITDDVVPLETQENQLAIQDNNSTTKFAVRRNICPSPMLGFGIAESQSNLQAICQTPKMRSAFASYSKKLLGVSPARSRKPMCDDLDSIPDEFSTELDLQLM